MPQPVYSQRLRRRFPFLCAEDTNALYLSFQERQTSRPATLWNRKVSIVLRWGLGALVLMGFLGLFFMLIPCLLFLLPPTVAVMMPLWNELRDWQRRRIRTAVAYPLSVRDMLSGGLHAQAATDLWTCGTRGGELIEASWLEAISDRRLAGKSLWLVYCSILLGQLVLVPRPAASLAVLAVCQALAAVAALGQFEDWAVMTELAIAEQRARSWAPGLAVPEIVRPPVFAWFSLLLPMALSLFLAAIPLLELSWAQALAYTCSAILILAWLRRAGPSGRRPAEWAVPRRIKELADSSFEALMVQTGERVGKVG